MGWKIPLFKPHIPPSLGAHIEDVLSTGQIANGLNVEVFEQLLRDYLGTPYVTTTGDISTSLTLCLFMAGVRPGDDVLMSPLVCLATSCPVRNLFANIRWCDVDPETGSIDPASIPRQMTSRTKAVIVYHWAGSPAEIETIQAAARDHGIAVIEDAGEALGAEYHGRKIGATGSDFTVFSFYPNRHVTTIDGAAISFKREEDYEKARWLKRYGIHQPSFRLPDGEINPQSGIPEAGWNTTMSNVAGAIGRVQMQHLSSILKGHQTNGLSYDSALEGINGIQVLKRSSQSLSAYWVYTLLAKSRDRLQQQLRSQGIQASTVHIRNDLYSCFGASPEPLPGVDYFSDHQLSIPCGWWVSDDSREQVVEAVLTAQSR